MNFSNKFKRDGSIEVIFIFVWLDFWGEVVFWGEVLVVEKLGRVGEVVVME